MLQQRHLARRCLRSCHQQKFQLMLRPMKLQHLDRLATHSHLLAHSDNRSQESLHQFQTIQNNVCSLRPTHWHGSPKAGGKKRGSLTPLSRRKRKNEKSDLYFQTKPCSNPQFETKGSRYFYSTFLNITRYQLTVEGWA